VSILGESIQTQFHHRNSVQQTFWREAYRTVPNWTSRDPPYVVVGSRCHAGLRFAPMQPLNCPSQLPPSATASQPGCSHFNGHRNSPASRPPQNLPPCAPASPPDGGRHDPPPSAPEVPVMPERGATPRRPGWPPPPRLRRQSLPWWSRRRIIRPNYGPPTLYCDGCAVSSLLHRLAT